MIQKINQTGQSQKNQTRCGKFKFSHIPNSTYSNSFQQRQIYMRQRIASCQTKNISRKLCTHPKIGVYHQKEVSFCTGHSLAILFFLHDIKRIHVMLTKLYNLPYIYPGSLYPEAEEKFDRIIQCYLWSLSSHCPPSFCNHFTHTSSYFNGVI